MGWKIKPVAWAFRQDWGRFQADGSECRLLPNFYWGDDLAADNTYAPLYDQQAIDSLRAEVEALRGAFEQIGAIGNDAGGGDGNEIEEARGIAFRALERKRPE